MRRRWTPQLGLTLLAAALLTGCEKPGNAARTQLPAVTTVQPIEMPVVDAIDLTGTVTPSLNVDLVARVQGYLQSVNFQDGAFVAAKQLLFVIEPESYEQDLRQAQAALAQAQTEYDRQLTLVKENATSVANVEKWLSQRDQALAEVELAKLNLSYTKVTAPFSGRIGRRLVDPGNLVGPTHNEKLANLQQLAPIYVYFNLNERDLLRLRDAMRQRGLVEGSNIGKAPVFVGLQTEQGYPHEGTLDFVDTGISTSEGTIQIRATFKNEDQALVSGAFARVRIPLGQAQPMLVVPAVAVANDQEGDYVLVVGEDNLVARRAIVKGPETPAGTATREGLRAGDHVIIKGLMNVRPGVRVARTDAPASQPASAGSAD